MAAALKREQDDDDDPLDAFIAGISTKAKTTPTKGPPPKPGKPAAGKFVTSGGFVKKGLLIPAAVAAARSAGTAQLVTSAPSEDGKPVKEEPSDAAATGAEAAVDAEGTGAVAAKPRRRWAPVAAGEVAACVGAALQPASSYRKPCCTLCTTPMPQSLCSYRMPTLCARTSCFKRFAQPNAAPVSSYQFRRPPYRIVCAYGFTKTPHAPLPACVPGLAAPYLTARC